MRPGFVLLLAIAGILTGCKAFESHDFLITRATPGDAARVQAILRDVAAEAGIPRGRPTPYDSPTIALYKDPQVQLRASVSRGKIGVTLMRYDWPPPKAFIQADRLLVQALSASFEGRFGILSDRGAEAVAERTITVY